MASCGPLWSTFVRSIFGLLYPQVERLEEEKLELRRKLVNLQLSEVGSRRDDGSKGAEKDEERRREGEQRGLEETDGAMDNLQPVVDQLRTQVYYMYVWQNGDCEFKSL